MNSWAAFLLQLHSNRQQVRTLCDGKLVRNPKTWFSIFHDHLNQGIITLKPFCMKWEIAIITLRSSANGQSYLAIIKLHRYPLDRWPDATQWLYYLLQLYQISSPRRHWELLFNFQGLFPLGLAKVGGWSWCNSALHLIIGAFRDNGEGRWNQFPASSTNMGQPSSPSTPSSLSYLSLYSSGFKWRWSVTKRSRSIRFAHLLDIAGSSEWLITAAKS